MSKPVDITVFSPNILKLFQTCPAKFYYRYVEQIPAPILDKNFVTGKNIHAIASYYLKNIDVEKFENALNEKEAKMWQFLKQNKYFAMEVIGVEKNILSKLEDFWIGGRADAIVKTKNNYYILDYKTGGVNDDMIYDPQTMVYLISYDNALSDYDSLKFIYLDLKNQKETVISFSQELKQKYIEELIKLCNEIKNFNIKNFKTDMLCKCEYEKICGGLIRAD